jgi:hypothetical protein
LEKIMADEHTGLGKLIEGDKSRDAVHIAIAPVEATEKLFPGQGVSLLEGGATRVAASADWDGIVDPFLTTPVFPGQRFWMWMRPGSITSLRHEWTHPAFKPSASQREARAEVRLREMAPLVNMDFEEMIEGAKQYVASGDYMCDGGRFEGVSLPEGFWENFCTYTGIDVPEDNRWPFFSCSC